MDPISEAPSSASLEADVLEQAALDGDEGDEGFIPDEDTIR